MKPESRLELATRHIAEAEANIARVKRIIEECKQEGRSTQIAEALLILLEQTLKNAQQSLALLQASKSQSAVKRYQYLLQFAI